MGYRGSSGICIHEVHPRVANFRTVRRFDVVGSAAQPREEIRTSDPFFAGHLCTQTVLARVGRNLPALSTFAYSNAKKERLLQGAP